MFHPRLCGGVCVVVIEKLVVLNLSHSWSVSLVPSVVRNISTLFHTMYKVFPDAF